MKVFLFTIGCIIAWAMLLPLLLLSSVALFIFCAVAEIGHLFAGGGESPVTPSAARELALSMCLKFGRALPVRVSSLSR